MALRGDPAHQDTWKCQALPHPHAEWSDPLETARPIEPSSVQCRKAVQFAYAECPGLAEAAGRAGTVGIATGPPRALPSFRLLSNPANMKDNQEGQQGGR